MEDSQKQMFKEMMVTVCQQYKREVFDLKLLRLWWNALKFYDHNVVSLCFERWLITSEYMPTIADMVKMCRQKNEQRKNQLHNEEMAKLSYSKKAIENKKKFSMFIARSVERLNGKKPNKKWAVKILDRYEKGDYHNYLGLEMAREVVNDLSTKEREELCMK